MTDARRHRENIAMLLDLDDEAVPRDAYQDPAVLNELFRSGYEVPELATAFEVSERAIYDVAQKQGVRTPNPPSNGPARVLWEMTIDEFDRQVLGREA